MTEITNAIISGTSLEIEDHGIPTCWIYLDYGNASQGFGGYDLRFYGIWFMFEMMKVLEISSWDKLKGVPVRVKKDNKDMVISVGHFVKDKWFTPTDFKKESEK